MGLIKIPVPQTTLNQNKSGFTLIELLIVLGIIAMVMSLGLPAIERVTYQKLNSTTRKFVGTIRTIRNDSVLLNQVYRFAIDFEKNTWWVESQKRFELIQLNPEASKKKKKEEKVVSNFELVGKYNKEPQKLPNGLVFQGLLKEQEGYKKEGVAYIHFFPNGFADYSIIYLAKEGNANSVYSIIIKPVAGKVELERGIYKF
jgi:general secretion pathway protein H